MTRFAIDPHAVFLSGLVVQATFTLTLGLLAWSDRRTRGMGFLTTSAALNFLAMYYRMARGLGNEAPWDIPGTVIQLLTLFCMYQGLRWFVVRLPMRSMRWLALLAVYTAVALAMWPVLPGVTLGLLRCGCLMMVSVTLVMLWRTRFAALQLLARCIAALFGTLTVILLLRVMMTLRAGSERAVPLILYGREGVLLAITLLQFFYVAMFVAESKRRLHEETRLDVLTGLHNRRAIEETSLREVQLAREKGSPLALLMLDLDHFKALNDTWGHALGDRALRAVGGALLAEVGGGDCVARLGGEEFAVLLADTDMTAAVKVAERLRVAIAALRITQAGDIATLTVSIGVSLLHEGEQEWGPMLHRADVAAYEAKREGRNRVVACTTELETALDLSMPRKLRRDWRQVLLGRGPLL